MTDRQLAALLTMLADRLDSELIELKNTLAKVDPDAGTGLYLAGLYVLRDDIRTMVDVLTGKS